MVIFAHDVGSSGAAAGLFHSADFGVHIGLHIHQRVVVPALIVNEAGGVGVEVLQHTLDGSAGAGLVAGRPHDDAGIVLVPLHHADGAVLTSLHITGDIARYIVLAAAVVGLHVGLVHDVNTVLVAQLIEIGVAGVVGGTDGVDVVLLHELDFLLHDLLGDVPSGGGVHLAPVDALEVDGLTVEDHLGVGGAVVDDADLTEAHVDAGIFHSGAVLLQGEDQAVEVGMFGAPLEGIFIGSGQIDGGDTAGERRHLGGHGLAHRLIVCAVELCFHSETVGAFGAFGAQIPQLHFHVQIGVDIVFIQISDHGKVPDFHRSLGGEVDVAEDTGQTDTVLVFNVAAIGPAEDLHGGYVLGAGSEVQRVGDIELVAGGEVLGVADVLAVYIEVHGCFHALKTDKHIPAVPGGEIAQVLAVGTHRVILGGGGAYLGLSAVFGVLPGIVLVGVDGLVILEIAVLILDHLPAQRHGNGVPAAVVIVHIGEGLILHTNAVGGLFGPGEPPVVAVEQFIVAGSFGIAGKSLVGGVKGIGGGAGGLPVDFHKLGMAVPLALVAGNGQRTHGKGGEQHGTGQPSGQNTFCVHCVSSFTGSQSGRASEPLRRGWRCPGDPGCHCPCRR